MKQLLVILLTIILAACGSNNANPASEASNKPTIEQPKDPIIGTPKRFESIEIAERSFSKDMNWDEANAACKSLGNDWRLPTKYELNKMYLNMDKIGSFTKSYYWSSTENDESRMWCQSFINGFQYDFTKDFKNFVRAVRTY